MNLSPSEIRVLGCLLEKQRTTPDVYPLSLNSLRLACNQSTNRDPVVRVRRGGVARRPASTSAPRLHSPGQRRRHRAPKYRHLLAEALPMGEDEQAVMCVLMLRGPQTPGELKQRTERMHAFADLGGVHETLERLIGRGLVAVLERRPGQKEERYVQLLGEEAEVSDAAPSPMSMPTPAPRAVDGLEERVARLEREVAQLRAALGDEPGEQSSDRRPCGAGRSFASRGRVMRPATRRRGRGRRANGRDPRHRDPRRDDQLDRGHRHRGGHPPGARGRAGVVPLALRAATGAGLPLDRYRGRPGGHPARRRAPGPRPEPAVHRKLLADLHPAGPHGHAGRLAAHRPHRHAAHRSEAC